ncbi:unnamed protein product, partial [Rotaria sp. Silwood2]
MEHYANQFINLPDGILLIILKKLNAIDAFNLYGINERLDNILHDKIFTSKLTLFDWSSNELIRRLDDSLIDEFCLKILPQIHHKVKWLNLELSSIKRILLATDYPDLYGIGLYNMTIRMATY